MEKARKSNGKFQKKETFLEWLAGKIEADSRKEAQVEWEKLLADLRGVKEKHNLSWGVVEAAVRHCKDAKSEAPEEMVMEVREQIYKEFREGSPFVGN